MKAKLISVFLCLALLSGCGAPAASREALSGENALRVVATIFPLYDWARAVIGGSDAVELTLLLDKGVDLHSFQPSVDDLVTISNCDLLIYVGGESDGWIKDALAGAANANLVAVNLMKVLGNAVKEEELVEGMQSEEENAEDSGEEAPEYDEHVWLSLRNAETVCNVLAEKLGALDAENRDLYSANATAYIEKLHALDAAYQSAVDASPVKVLLFGDRFPFRYLTDDYGLKYYAAFSGCSAETEASFETVVFLAEKLDALGLKAVLTIESGDGALARTIIASSHTPDAEVLQLDSLQSITRAEIDAGATYLGTMEQNLDVLRKALP